MKIHYEFRPAPEAPQTEAKERRRIRAQRPQELHRAIFEGGRENDIPKKQTAASRRTRRERG